MKTSRRQLICFYVARVVKIANLITTSIKTIIFFLTEYASERGKDGTFCELFAAATLVYRACIYSADNNGASKVHSFYLKLFLSAIFINVPVPSRIFSRFFTVSMLFMPLHEFPNLECKCVAVKIILPPFLLLSLC